MQLPNDFIHQTRPIFGEERFERFIKALDEDLPVSFRVNPRLVKSDQLTANNLLTLVPWCRNGYYLPTRQNFTFDPLFHAGCYYVQEASSMFLDEVLRQVAVSNWQLTLSQKLTALDLCAAPGGKSTLLRSVLPADCVLYSNEPNRKRASILLENVTKWGYDNHFVTNCYPRDYRKAKMKFDLILCDVPCSGEGMFRKDPDSIQEWSLQNVIKCQQLQREIVSDAWECLNDGGLLIYSTCTYNTKEDEENVRWIKEELGAEILSVETKPEWGITGSLLEGFDEPVYRFIPGYTRGEGLFMAVMRRPTPRSAQRDACKSKNPSLSREGSGYTRLQKSMQGLNVMTSPTSEYQTDTLCDVDYKTAMAFLRGEAIQLPSDTPRGIVAVSFMGQHLGFVKNIGSRANNLYPKEWRIKTTHVPHDYEPVLSVWIL
jgi:16S rRNA C967 or C1407 C5-methylase (RsmB/RsmF family)